MKIDIISGFLGAGKTTFIERLLKTDIKNEKVVLVENEYGEVSVDTDILKDTKIEMKELSQGCICCSLVGDFTKALNELVKQENPDRIIIEPSGVGKLSDIVAAVKNAGMEDSINSLVCLVDAKKAKMYAKNFGEFFNDQISNAHTVILSRTDIAKEDKISEAVEVIRGLNSNCVLVTTSIQKLSDEELIKAYEGFDTKILDNDDINHAMAHSEDEECDDPNCSCHHHHHHHDEDDDDYDDDEHEHHHHHHHHDHDEECHCHEEGHHHHHDDDDDEECDDPNCSCHHHHDHDDEVHHHHHHHADEVFASVGIETVKKYDIDAFKALLNDMAEGKYGIIVRAKGIIEATDGNWYLFQLTPEEVEVSKHHSIPMAKIVVIGHDIKEEDIKKLF